MDPIDVKKGKECFEFFESLYKEHGNNFFIYSKQNVKIFKINDYIYSLGSTIAIKTGYKTSRYFAFNASNEEFTLFEKILVDFKIE